MRSAALALGALHATAAGALVAVVAALVATPCRKARVERSGVVLAEGAQVECFGVFKRAVQIAFVFLTIHPKIGVVVQEVAEEVLAVPCIGTGVKDMLVPEEVNVFGGDGRPRRVDFDHHQEPAVAMFDVRSIGFVPTLPLFCVHDFAFDHGQIDLANLGQSEISFVKRHDQQGWRRLDRFAFNVFSHLGFLSGGCWWRGGGGEDAAQDQGDTGSSGSGIGCEDFCRGLGGGGQAGGIWPPPVLVSAEGALDVGGDHLAGPEAADRGAGFAVRLGTGHLGFLSGGCWWRGGAVKMLPRIRVTRAVQDPASGAKIFAGVLVAGARQNSHIPCPIHQK